MKDLQVLTNALDAAIKAGVYNLQDAGLILQSINNLGQSLRQSTETKNAEKEPLPKVVDLEPLPKNKK